MNNSPTCSCDGNLTPPLTLFRQIYCHLVNTVLEFWLSSFMWICISFLIKNRMKNFNQRPTYIICVGSFLREPHIKKTQLIFADWNIFKLKTYLWILINITKCIIIKLWIYHGFDQVTSVVMVKIWCTWSCTKSPDF